MARTLESTIARPDLAHKAAYIDIFLTYAVQAAVLCGSTNIFVGGRLRLRNVAEGLRFDCGRYGSFAVCMVFSVYMYAVFAVYLRFSAVLCCGNRTAENRGLKRISGKMVYESY